MGFCYCFFFVFFFEDIVLPSIWVDYLICTLSLSVFEKNCRN